MIFRLNGTVEETLALTPVIQEWFEMSGEKIIMDTLYPDLFAGNLYVDRILCPNDVLTDASFDFSTVCWQKALRPVTETYAEYALGKVRLKNWRTLMTHSQEEASIAASFDMPAKLALITLKQLPEGLISGLKAKGYATFLPDQIKPCRGVLRALASLSSLYIGEDGAETAIALTTDVPAVVCYTFRNPVYFAPFRRDIPFEAIVPGDICGMAGSCLQGNGKHEFNRTYGIHCRQPEPFVCKQYITADMILDRVDKIGR